MRKHREVLRKVLQQHISFGSFDLSSGGTTDFYIDVRPMLLSSGNSRAIAFSLLGRMETKASIISGIGLSGSLIVSAMLAHTVKDIKGLIVRKRQKTHGLTRTVEGDVAIQNCDVVLVDDVLSTGTNLMYATRALQDLRHCQVVQWIVIVDRSTAPIEGAPEISAVFKDTEILEGIKKNK